MTDRHAPTALITGASSGIGKEFARIHAEHGGDAVIVARRIEALNELRDELQAVHGVRVHVIAKDLAEPNAAQAIYDEVRAAGFEVDYLINNAGFGGHGMFFQREWAHEQAMISVNIVALTQLCHLFLPEFVARNRGCILNVSSTASFVPGPLQAVYYASKAFVQSFSNAIAEELYQTNVTVTNLMPAATDTGFARVADMENTSLFQQMASARKVAEDGYQGMLEGKLDVVTGVKLKEKLLMKLVPLFPKRYVLRRIRRMQEKLS